MLSGHTIGLLRVKQPHDSILTALVITCVPSRGDQPCSFRLQKLAPQHCSARLRDCQELMENHDISDL